jgi:methyl-accepting chemotaxis protein
MNDGLTRVLLALTIVIGIGVLIQIIVLGALAIAALKTRKKVHALMQRYEVTLAPHITSIIANVRGLSDDLSPKIKAISGNVRIMVDDLTPKVKAVSTDVRFLADELTPKIKTISDDAVEVSGKVKQAAENIVQTVNDVVDRTHQKATRVDDMVSGTLNGIDHATSAVQHGISIPLRRINGILEGLRVGLNTLRHKERVDGGGPNRYPPVGDSVRGENRAATRAEYDPEFDPFGHRTP